jgi:quinol monooxygenase YgiN
VGRTIQKSAGFLNTELLRDEKHTQRYLTIDRWKSKEDFEIFQSQWEKEYKALDIQCEGLTECESLIGNFGNHAVIF